MRFWYLSHQQAAKAQPSLRIRAVSPEPSLLTYTKYRRLRVRLDQPHPPPLDVSVWAFKGGFCANVISIKILCAGPNLDFQQSPSRHTMLQCRRIDVDAISHVDMKLFQRNAFAGHNYTQCLSIQ